MSIAIISDIHNNEVNLKKVLDYCQREKIPTIICCGDLASEETLNFLNNNFSGNIHYTFGNLDNDQLINFEFTDKYKNTFIYKNFGEIIIPSSEIIQQPKNQEIRIAFVHYPQKAKKLCETGKYTHVFYGHTHKPWLEKINNCLMLNPGNTAGEIYPPTFAVWNIDKDDFKLIRVHDLK